MRRARGDDPAVVRPLALAYRPPAPGWPGPGVDEAVEAPGLGYQQTLSGAAYRPAAPSPSHGAGVAPSGGPDDVRLPLQAPAVAVRGYQTMDREAAGANDEPVTEEPSGIEEARLEEARIEEARIEEARLEEARIEEARLEEARIEDSGLGAARRETRSRALSPLATNPAAGEIEHGVAPPPVAPSAWRGRVQPRARGAHEEAPTEHARGEDQPAPGPGVPLPGERSAPAPLLPPPPALVAASAARSEGPRGPAPPPWAGPVPDASPLPTVLARLLRAGRGGEHQPPIRVSIGRIEVRAVPPPSPPPAPPRPRQPKRSLDDYLAERDRPRHP